MSEGYRLKILVPSGLVVDTEVSMVTLPTELGQVGILPQHMNYSSILGTGILEYYPADGGAPNKLVVSCGFASFTPEGLQILADSVDVKDSLNVEIFAGWRSEAESIMRDYPIDSFEYKSARSRLERVEAIEQL